MMHGGYFGLRGLGNCFGGFGYFSPILMIGFWIVLALVVFWMFRRQKIKGSNQDALEILKTRYVNGEINEEEYNRKKETLMRK